MLGTAKPFHPPTTLGGVLAAALLLAASCGGGAGLSAPAGSPEAAWPRNSWDGAAKSGSFMVAAVDASGERLSPLHYKLGLRTEAAGANTRVRVRAQRLLGEESAYLHLRYDASSVHPVLSQAGAGLTRKVIFIGIDQVPGTLALGLQLLPGALPLSGEAELALVEFAPGPAPARRGASAVTASVVDDLRFDTVNTDTLEFSYNTAGDYDQNSEVNVADITPIGQHFMKTPAAGDWQAAQLADGDSNGEVNIADLTPIGANFLSRCTAWQVQSGPAEAGPWGDVAGGSIAQSSGTAPGGGGFLEYSLTVGSPVDGAWYCLVALDGSARASGRSNAVQFGALPSLLPPANLTAVKNGTQIQLDWDAPSGATPDSYNTYVADNQAMTGAQSLGTNIVTTSYMVSALFSPDAEWYFGVKAVYGATESAFASVHYGSVANDSPQQLTAVKSVDHIALQWAAPASGSPDGYNAYIGTDSAMSDAVRLNGGTPVSGLNYDCATLFSPDNPYYFGVKAIYGASESDYSNIFFYDPSGGGGDDLTAPVWQGGIGIKTVEPDDTLCHVSWWPAVDADTPPVQYLLYVVPSTEQIDWNSPRDVFPGSTLETNVTGLTNYTEYRFAVRAQDSVSPNPNVTTNTNEILATPMILPGDGNINSIMSSDVSSVRMSGEEVPRIVAVNHSSELWYVYWNGTDWHGVDLNTTLNIPARKYHPKILARGGDIHIAFGTSNAVYEVFGDKNADPSAWTLQTISSSGISQVYGLGFDYDPSGDYFAIVFATNSGGEKVFYSDRDRDGGLWFPPVSIFDGSPKIWQCDLALNENDGSQCVVASNGDASSDAIDLSIWQAMRPNRTGSWQVTDTGYNGGEELDLAIDPLTHSPVFVASEARVVDTGFGNLTVTDMSVFTWTGSSWLKQVLDAGDFTFDGSSSATTILTGRDPVITFDQGGEAVAGWTHLNMVTDLLDFDQMTDLTGEWRTASSSSGSWGPSSSIYPHIMSSNTFAESASALYGTGGDMGLIDTLPLAELNTKYGTRNDFPVGDMYFQREVF